MPKIEAVGSKEKLENKAASQDWEGITMTKTEAVQEVQHLPKDKQGMLKNDNTILAKKPEPTRKPVPFEPAPQTSSVGSRSTQQSPEQRRREDVARYQKAASLPASPKESTVAEKVGEIKEEAKRVKENLRQRGEEAKQDIRQKGWEFKNEAEKKKKEAEDWIRLEKELANNKVQQGERKVEEGKEKLTSGIKGLENRVIEEAKDFGTAVVDTTQDVKEGLQHLGEDMKEGAQVRWQEFKGKLSEAPKNIAEEGEYIGKVVKDKATEIGEKAKDTFWSTEEKAKAKAREADRKLKEAGQKAKGTATEAMEEGKQKLKEREQRGMEALYDTEKKAGEYARRAKEAMGEKKKEVTDSMGDLKERIEENINNDIDRMYGAKDKLTDEFKREAYYAKDKAEELWEGGKQEVKDFGTAVKKTAQDVKEGLTPKSATPVAVPVIVSTTTTTTTPPVRRTRSSSIGEAIDRAFTSTPDTNRPVMSDIKWRSLSKDTQPDMTPVKTILSDESKTREVLREQVIQEEKRSPGFVTSLMDFVFGASRNPDVASAPTASEEELNKQKLTRLNTIAYSPAGTIIPSDYEEEGNVEKAQLPSLRRHSIAGGELDAETARKFDRYAGFQYSPAIGAPSPSEVLAKEQELPKSISRELPSNRPTQIPAQIPITTSTTPERTVRIFGVDMNLGTPNNLPESATSSYFQTYHRSMPSEEVEERVLESTIDFFY